MDITIQSLLLNVSDLKQSIEFYRSVFDFNVVSEADRVTAVMVNQSNRRQVLVLRELGPNAYHGGRGNIGFRMVSFEVGSLEDLELIEQRFVDRQALVWHGSTEAYRSILGLDPDRIEISVSSSLSDAPITSEDWRNLDDTVYTID